MYSKIPKRIIQIWGGGRELPLLGKAAAANIRLLNPDFEYILFDDARMADFIDQCFPEYRSVFDAFSSPIQRYDFFRYLAIYRLGGFYFDMDVFLASNLSDLLDFGCVFSFEMLTVNHFLREEYGMDWEIANYAFGAAAGHPFIRAIIENCIRAQNDPQWAQSMMRSIPRIFRDEFAVTYATGPGLVSRSLADYPDANQIKILFPENICDRNSWSLFGQYGVHLMAGSWRKKRGILRRQLLNAWWGWKMKNALKESQKLGGIRTLEFGRKT